MQELFYCLDGGEGGRGEIKTMIIGKNSETKENVNIDLQRLISTRLLIQANSGGGKSWLIRRILEQTYGKVQQLVIDLEGEFSTLREKYDYLLVGKDGEIPANIQTAELLARKLLKLNVSTIIDLSELQKHERILFVKRFLDSMVNAPRELWHTCLVIVDEAHQFCPEGTRSESASSVIDLQTRGRKRGFCGILATQRIAKLHKDAAAECNNVLVGRTVIDIDRKRAANDLGFTTKSQELSLKKLEDGEFFGYGPAISKDDYIKVKVGDIKTTHPEPGKNIIKASKTPENIKKLMKDVIDLPKEAEEELKTKKEFQNKIHELKRELRTAKQSQLKPIADEKALQRAKDQGYKEVEKQFSFSLRDSEKESKKLTYWYQKEIKDLENKINSIRRILGEEVKKIDREFPEIKPMAKPKVVPRIPMDIQSPPVTPSHPQSPSHSKIQNDISNDIGDDTNQLGAGPRKIYSFLYNNPDRQFTKPQIGAVTGYASRGGSFNTYLSQLNTLGLIERNGGLIKVKELNADIIQDYDFSINAIIPQLGAGPRKIYQFLLKNSYDEFSKEDIAGETGFSARGGSFNTYLSKLNTLGLIKRVGSMIKLNPELLELM